MFDEIYYKSSCSPNQQTISLSNLIEEGWVEILGDGRVILNKDFITIMQLFDTIIMMWAAEDNAVSYQYPDFYSCSELNKCGYIQQFHGHCFFPSINNSDYFDSNMLKYTDYICNPAICMHSYIQYQNSKIEKNSPVVITAKGKCKRNERDGFSSLERLLDFTMREIVFLGSEKYVMKKRIDYMDKAKQLVEHLNLNGRIQISHDPFFRKEDEVKVSFQKKFKLKYELLLNNPDSNNDVAVGSFNYHNINFSKAYKIYLDDNHLAHTACIAFGLERLAFVYLMQVGINNCCNLLKEYIVKFSK